MVCSRVLRFVKMDADCLFRGSARCACKFVFVFLMLFGILVCVCYYFFFFLCSALLCSPLLSSCLVFVLSYFLSLFFSRVFLVFIFFFACAAGIRNKVSLLCIPCRMFVQFMGVRPRVFCFSLMVGVFVVVIVVNFFSYLSSFRRTFSSCFRLILQKCSHTLHTYSPTHPTHLAHLTQTVFSLISPFLISRPACCPLTGTLFHAAAASGSWVHGTASADFQATSPEK